jgi:alkylated DNA repair dioxygenase AlkB
VVLRDGSLLVMAGTTQGHWKHRIPRTTRALDERINLTFRLIHARQA